MKYTAIRSEGGLIPYDLLEQIANEQVPGQKAADFGLPKGRRLSDQIQRVWSDAQDFWDVFRRRMESLTDKDPHGTTLTRERWLYPLLNDPETLAYDLKLQPSAISVGGATFPISHLAGDSQEAPPVHVEGFRVDLDHRGPKLRTSPRAMVQEFLNRSEENLWGIATNGLRVLLLRDSARTARPTFLEFDLQTILEGNHYSEFALFYRLCHRSRLPRSGEDPTKCWLEQYYQLSVEQGGRVRDKLRDGVEEALKLLGTGFLRHPANEELRENLASGRLSHAEYHRQLLRLVYRLLFLMVAEERDLIVATGEDAERHQRNYDRYYSISRLRDRAEDIVEKSNFADLWVGLKKAFSLFSDTADHNPLGIPPLNGELFSHRTIPDLEETQFFNHDLLITLRRLSLFQEDKVFRRVNYSQLNVEELGSIYESLLDFHPVIEKEAEGMRFDLQEGSERKTTGSYYTRPELVRELIQSALMPVIEDRLAEAEKQTKGKSPEEVREAKEKVILSMAVCDPACGSGHFLLEAARRLGRELARIRSGQDEPSPEEFHLAVRDAIAHCIYGVDLNPLAVDLCKLALWLEGHWIGKPLSFLDHRIKCGNSLIGVLDPEALEAGIPDKAFTAVTGDDKKIASAYKKRNKLEREHGQKRLDFEREKILKAFSHPAAEPMDFAEDKPEDVRRKQELYRKVREQKDWMHDSTAANLWMAAFFAPITKYDDPVVTTYDTFMEFLLHGHGRPQMTGYANALSVERCFFHWRLELPEVFAKGGFDVILGNPPWDILQPEEIKFFATAEPAIAHLPGARRKTAIESLPETNPALAQKWETYKRSIETTGKFIREGDRFQLTAVGKLNTYALFAELSRQLINSEGRAGVLIPTGIATDDSTKGFFSTLVGNGELASLIGFENEAFIFPAIHHSTKFCALTLTGRGEKGMSASFMFFCRDFDDIHEKERQFQLSDKEIRAVNPNTRTCPVFRSRADAELTKKIYQRVPILVNERTGENPWGVEFRQGLFNMTSDSHLFRTEPGDGLLPLYEAKMMYQFDHRYGTYEGATQAQLNVGTLPRPNAEQKRDPHFAVRPRYWVPEAEIIFRLSHVPPVLIQALQVKKEELVAQILIQWIASYYKSVRNIAGEEGLRKALPIPLWQSSVGMFQDLITQEIATDTWQEKWPLTPDDIALMQREDSYMDFAEKLIVQRCPKWLLGFRDITSSVVERTAIFSLLPRVGVGHTAPVAFLRNICDPKFVACFLANVDSLPFDYVARQKVGGTHLTFFVLEQLPALPPRSYSAEDVEWLSSRVLELVYTSWELKVFADELGYDGEPFTWDEDRRALLRAELDAYYAQLYGLTRDELRYILDPKEIFGEDFPSETFRVLKEKEIKQFGQYRTQRLVLAAYDELAKSDRFAGENRESAIEAPKGRSMISMTEMR